MGIRPAPFIKDPCGCEGFTPPLLFFDFLYLLPAKAVVTRMGGDKTVGFVSLRVRRSAPCFGGAFAEIFFVHLG
jgi:hypothetical protein